MKVTVKNRKTGKTNKAKTKQMRKNNKMFDQEFEQADMKPLRSIDAQIRESSRAKYKGMVGARVIRQANKAELIRRGRPRRKSQGKSLLKGK